MPLASIPRLSQLTLLRHAQAVPDGYPDHERPLSKQGEDEADRLAAWIRLNMLTAPDCVLCSTSRRTVATWERVVPSFSKLPEVRFERGLYLASMSDLIGMTQDFAGSLMVIGHNPGLQEWLAALTGNASLPFVTGALAVIDHDDRGCHLSQFITPEESIS